MYKSLIVLITVFLLINNQIYSQKMNEKGEYIYMFKPFSMPSYYFYQEIKSEDVQNTLCSSNISIEINFVDRYGDMEVMENIEIKSSDTAIMYLNKYGKVFYDADRKLYSFDFKTFPHKLEGFVPLNKDTYKILLTIVVGSDKKLDKLATIIIISKKELNAKDLIMIGNDIIYETNNSEFIRGEDYYWVSEI